MPEQRQETHQHDPRGERPADLEGNEERVEDLDVPEAQGNEVKGGRKAGAEQQGFLTVKLTDTTISS